MSESKPQKGSPNDLVPSHVKYRRERLETAKAKAAFEGVDMTNYMRSALEMRIRETDIKQAEYERRKHGETSKG